MQILDGYIHRFTPGAKMVGQTAQAYADRIIALLDAIHDAVLDEEFVETRRRFDVVLLAGVNSVVQVPAGETWELDVVTIVAAAALSIRESGQLRYATTLTTGKTDPALGIVFNGGADITISGTAGDTCYLQFKRRTLNIAKRSNAAGWINGNDGATQGVDPTAGHDGDARHAAMFEQGHNIRGAARGDGLAKF